MADDEAALHRIRVVGTVEILSLMRGMFARAGWAVMAGAAIVLAAGCSGSTGSGPAAPSATAIPAGQPLGSAGIAGRVLLDGAAPPPEPIKMTEAACQHGHTSEPVSETIAANADGSLRNVIVAISSGLPHREFAPPETATIDQLGCTYTPHVISVQTNQLVTFVNGDTTLHNVHAVSKVNTPFNFGMPTQGLRIAKFFTKPEIVKMKCDVHPWMASYIGVFDHPFHAVTGEGGTYALKGLPAGTYEVTAWHEKFGAKTQTVEIADGAMATLDFHFAP